MASEFFQEALFTGVFICCLNFRLVHVQKGKRQRRQAYSRSVAKKEVKAMVVKNYRTKEAAEMIGVKPETLEVWRVYGKGPRFCKVGRRVVYPEDEIKAYLDSLKRFQSTSER